MSEADSQTNQVGLPAFAESDKSVAATDSATSEGQAADTEGWQTVDFPGAMSVDALLQAENGQAGNGQAGNGELAHGVIHYSSADISPTTTDAAVMPIALVDEAVQRQQLQAENAALRDRLMQVEHALAQQQLEWQLESLRMLSESELATSAAVNPLACTDPAIGQAPVVESTLLESAPAQQQRLQELERSQQTAQRQQILVETLTEQLESSQERIAQLERDCALTQSRHNEQVQQVLQAEATCRDLRLRLHRQQQQTLQFKAALEKCLEMPAPYGAQAMPDLMLDDSPAVPDSLSELLKTRHQPVVPWSQATRADADLTSDPVELPQRLLKLLKADVSVGNVSVGDVSVDSDGVVMVQGTDALSLGQDTPFGTAFAQDGAMTDADASALLSADDPQFVSQLMQLMFPTTAEPLTDATIAVHQADPIALAPALDTEAAMDVSTEHPSLDAMPSALLDVTAEPPEQQPSDAVSPKAETIDHPAPALLPADASTDPLWADLERLIEPSLPVEPDTTTADCRPAIVLPTKRTGIPAIVVAAHAMPSPVDVAPADAATDHSTTLTTWTWRDRLASAGKSARSHSMERDTQSSSKLLALSATVSSPMHPSSFAEDAEPRSLAAIAHSPSPIVYPLRYTKKLASLAAVNLPTFPKR